jgi:hypothetical protein
LESVDIYLKIDGQEYKKFIDRFTTDLQQNAGKSLLVRKLFA